MNCHRRLSAWESGPSRAFTCPELRSWLSASDREIPVFTGVNGTAILDRTVPDGSPTFRFSGRTYLQLARIVRELCAVAGCCCQRLAAAVAVTVAVSRWSWSPSPRSPRTRRRSSFVWPSEEAAQVQPQRRPGRLQRLLRKDSFPHSHRVGPQPSLSRAKATCRPIVPLSNGKRKCPYGFLALHSTAQVASGAGCSRAVISELPRPWP